MAKYIIDVLNTQHYVVQSWGIDPKSVKTIIDGPLGTGHTERALH